MANKALSWTTRVLHDTDAHFREYGLELENKLTEAGFVKTSDTGQIDWTTATRSAINTLTAGYNIWRFNDTMQSTAPIYFRIDYGTDSTSTFPRMALTVGTGSNGSGTITGTALTAQRDWTDFGNPPSDIGRQSFLSAADGLLCLVWKHYNSASNGGGAFFICRTCDANGDATATGAIVCWGSGNINGNATRQALRFASPAAAYTANTTDAASALGINPQAQASTVLGNDIQAALAFTTTPRAEPLVGICGVVPNEIAAFSTFKAILVGTRARRYIVDFGRLQAFGPISNGTTGNLSCAFLWEND